MKEQDENLIQLSLFSDGDTRIDNSGKKIEKNLRDVARDLKKCSHIDSYHNCAYNLSEDEGVIKCQIEFIQKRQNGKRIPPCLDKCGTDKCFYYTRKHEE